MFEGLRRCSKGFEDVRGSSGHFVAIEGGRGYWGAILGVPLQTKEETCIDGNKQKKKKSTELQPLPNVKNDITVKKVILFSPWTQL
jgi:hypothetical protein